MDFTRKEKYDMNDLLRVVTILRSPGGCPWDREQTHASIRPNLIEETYEVAEAIDLADSHLLCEELGDLLLQILLHTEMEREANRFTFDDVCDGLCQKLIYRHPHVFGDVQVDSTGQVLKNWENLKNAEKGRDTAADRLNSVPVALPALMRSEKVQKRAAEFGFGYKDTDAALRDLESEVAELRQALADGEGETGEVGDVLFAATNVARFVGADAEEALGQSCQKFVGRVVRAEELAQQAGEDLKAVTDARRDEMWRVAKAEEKG